MRHPVDQTCATSTPTTATRNSQGGASPSRRPVAWPTPRKSKASAVEPPKRRRSARRLKSHGEITGPVMLARGQRREAQTARGENRIGGPYARVLRLLAKRKAP